MELRDHTDKGEGVIVRIIAGRITDIVWISQFIQFLTGSDRSDSKT